MPSPTFTPRDRTVHGRIFVWLAGAIAALGLFGLPALQGEESNPNSDPAGQLVSRNEGSKGELYYSIEYKPADWQAQAALKVKSYDGTNFVEVDLASGTATSGTALLTSPVSKIENEIVVNRAYTTPAVVATNVAWYRFRLVAPAGCEMYYREAGANTPFKPGSVLETTVAANKQFEVVAIPVSRAGSLPGKASKVSPGDGSMGMALGFLANGQSAGFVELMPRLLSKKDLSSGTLVATYGRTLSAADLSCISLSPDVEVITLPVPECNGQPATRGLRQVIAPQAVVDVKQSGFDLWVKFYLPSQKQSRLTGEPDGTFIYLDGAGPYTFSGQPFVTYHVQWTTEGWVKTSGSGSTDKVYSCPSTFTIIREEGTDSKTVTLSKTEKMTISAGRIEYRTDTCPDCGGSGSQNYDYDCSACNGYGTVQCYGCGGWGSCTHCGGGGLVDCSACGSSGSKECPGCGGNGSTKCGTCGGKGSVPGDTEVNGEKQDEECPECSGAGYQCCGYCGGFGSFECETCAGAGQLFCGMCFGSGTCSVCNGFGDVYCSACGGAGHIAGSTSCGTCGGAGGVVVDVIVPPTYVNTTEDSVINGLGSHLTQNVSTTTRYDYDGTGSGIDYSHQFNTTVIATTDASFNASVYEGKFPAYRREVVDTEAGTFGAYDLSDGTQKIKTSRSGPDEPQAFYGYYRLTTNDALYPTHHGRSKWQITPSGSWAMLDYSTSLSSLGQVTRVISPYKDVGMPSWSNALKSWNLTEDGSQAIADDYDLTMPSRIPDGTSLTGMRVTSTTYDGLDWEGVKRLPTEVIETADNKRVGHSKLVYSSSTANGQPVWITDTYVYPSSATDGIDSAALHSVTKVYGGPNIDFWLRGMHYSSQSPDGAKVAMAYHRGTYNSANKTFIVSASGQGFRSVVIKGRAVSSDNSTQLASYDGSAIDPLYVVANLSTAEVTIRDDRAFTVRTEILLYTGGGWILVDSSDMQYDGGGNLTRQEKLNGMLHEASWTNGRKDWEKNEQGLTTHFHYDDEGRVSYTVRDAVNSVPAIKTTFTYDADNRVRSTTIGEADSEHIISAKTYDKSGRVLTETVEGFTTQYDYAVGADGLTKTTITLPGGAIRILENYRDGRPKSVTGTAALAEYYHYLVDGSCCEVVTKFIAVDNGPRWTKTYSDWAGRTVRTESSSTGGNLVTTSVYDNAGKLTSSTIDTLSPILYTYDGNGVMSRSGQDNNKNGVLDANDRINSYVYGYRHDGSVWSRYEGDTTTWWDYSETRAYPDGSIDGQVQTRTWTRGGNFSQVSGPLGVTGIAIAESVAADANGNRAVTQTFLDRASATVTTVVWSPFASQPSISKVIAGHLDSQNTSSGVAVSYGYDVLGRAKSFTDRTGTSNVTYYPDTTRIKSVIDSRNVVQHAYKYNSSGRLAQDETPRVINGTTAGTNSSYLAYNARGQITNVWGDASNPVKYDYDDYGDCKAQYTYRDNGVNWSASDLATGGWPGSGDKTTFSYYDTNGLLNTKTDASNKTITYTYNVRGQLKTRTWARNVVATYAYADSTTGELQSTAYSDGTPTLSFTYDRLGRMQTVQDATGARTFTYRSTDLQPEAELFGRLNSTVTNHLLGASRQLTNQYEPGTGRIVGFSLDNNGTSEQALTYGYDLIDGSLQSIASGAGVFRYSYLANSNLISGVTRGLYSQSRQYATDRNILKSLTTDTQVGRLASYSYTCDDLGRRTSVDQSGLVYAPYAASGQVMHTAFGYDQRGQVTSATTSVGGAGLPGRSFGYAFDPIGNRTKESLDGSEYSYTPNALNQYDSRNTPTYLPATGTANHAAGGANLTIDGNSVTNWTNNYFYLGVNKGGATSPYLQSLNFSASASGMTQSETVWSMVRPTHENFVHDDDGNLTSDSLWVYRYDGENQLTSIHSVLADQTGHHLAVFFTYDYMGRRASKEVVSFDGDPNYPTNYSRRSKTYFAWHGWTLLAEYDQNLTLLRRFTFGVDLSGSLGDLGGLLAIEDKTTTNGGTYLAVHDGNGNLTALADGDTGALAATYEYDSFGNPLRATGSYAKRNPFRFAGKYFDTETGLSYYGLRYYCASTGRFINRDPIEEAGGLNMYAIANNDIINHADYLGMSMDWGDIGSAFTDFTNRFSFSDNGFSYTSGDGSRFDFNCSGSSQFDFSMSYRGADGTGWGIQGGFTGTDYQLSGAYHGESNTYFFNYAQEAGIARYTDTAPGQEREYLYFKEGGRASFTYGVKTNFMQVDVPVAKAVNAAAGTLQAAGGVAEVVAGVTFAAATSVTGIGPVAGGAVALHGIDTVIAGVSTIWTGSHQSTMTQAALQDLGMSSNAAGWADAGIGIVGSLAPAIEKLAPKLIQKLVSAARTKAGPANVRIVTGELGELQSAFAKIERGNIGQGTATNASSRTFARTMGNATDDAGHAVGENLGGLGGVKGRNIFPQAPSINRGAFNQFEQQIARRAVAGDEVFVRIVPRYQIGATRPYEILYQARINGSTISRIFKNP